MNQNFQKRDFLQCSMWGVLRGFCVQTLNHPFHVLKVRQQASSISLKSWKIAQSIFSQEGVGAFYKGLTPKLIHTCVKQFWCWPMIMGMPPWLQSHSFDKDKGRMITGFSIATMDALILSPLEKANITSAFSGRSTFQLKNIYQSGWSGFLTYWSKLSVNWVAFLVAQKHFRNLASKDLNHPLSSYQLIYVGVQVALAVSVVSAPFDLANTLKQACHLSPKLLWSRQGMTKLFRGWPLNATTLVIHNIASVILMETLIER